MLYVRISIAVFGKYRAAFSGISIAPSAQISIYLIIPSSTADATAVPLPHKDFSKSGEGWYEWKAAATTVRPTPSSRFQRATFPAIGKVYPTKLGKAERAKVGFGQLSTYGS